MADFLNRPLSVVSRLFQFRGAATIRSSFDVGTPIQPVHDVSREAELGTRGQAQNGYLELGQTITHVGVGTLFFTSDVYALFDSIFEFSDFASQSNRKDRLWLLGLFATTEDVADFASAASGILYQDPTREYLLARWDTAVNGFTAVGNAPLIGTDLINPKPSFPIFFPPGSLWDSTSVADNVGTTVTRIFSRWWAGPQGVTPPGMR